ncbi:MAG: hypothetical protein DMF32_09560 [Verrucomicrobia bacterium]|nr:MAG: hypothetical protein DMF32_09560 [Verrucomicrobiota bacterium]
MLCRKLTVFPKPGNAGPVIAPRRAEQPFVRLTLRKRSLPASRHYTASRELIIVTFFAGLYSTFSPELKLSRCPRSFAAALAALPSISEIPFLDSCFPGSNVL